jgi:small subunit ribosomal protein S4e
MGKDHLKRINAPRNWRLGRKERMWVARPKPGAHPINACLTLDTIARDMLSYGKNAREVSYILSNKEFKVDRGVRTDKKFAVGLMDVVEVPKLNDKFRVCYNARGELVLVKIDGKEVSQKLLKIKTKTKIAGGKLQLGFHDGRTILMDKCDSKIGDSALFDLDKKTALKFLPLEKGALVLIVGGKNTGTIGTVKELVPGNKLSRAMCVIETKNGELSTYKDYVFVVGKEKSEITVEVVK